MTAANETMIAACPRCRARYRIERARLPEQGARLRCSRCEASFRVTPPAPTPSEPRSGPELPASSAPASGVPAADRGAPERRRVVVADPDVAAGKELAATLADQGLEPLLVHDGVEAILAIQRSLPSLVVLEASLPKMFGFQVCELMKRNQQLRAIPVVLVGAIHHRERYRRQAADTYGADAYVERPELPEALLEFLRQRGLVAPVERPRAEPPASRAEPAAPRPAPPRSRAEEPIPARPSAEPEPVPARPAAAATEAMPVPARPAASGPGTDPELAADIARAERLARIIVSDIVLYNPERFAAAIRSGDLVGGMAAEMEEGRAHFRERISERVRGQKDFLGEELARVARLRGAT